MAQRSDIGAGCSDGQLAGAPSRRLILVTGGARSGKSRYAETLAARIACGRPVVYVATATPGDDEMRARIAAHRARRAPSWHTLEEPRDPGAAIQSSGAALAAAVVLVDCVTLLASNAMLRVGDAYMSGDDIPLDTYAEERAAAAVESLLAAYRMGSASFVVVTNEVGMGLVPAIALGRRYRDVLGSLNSQIAAEADAVVLLLAGIPIELKALGAAWNDALRAWLGDDGSA
jgi:adenosylcobinamide kinase/adenosylcobinamide-phosphate guanylyltransferase